MSNDEKTPLTVEGLGEKTVPDVKGMNNASAEEAKVDVTAMPTVSEPAPVEKVDVTSTPTVSAPKEPETFDPTSMPSASNAPSKPIDYKKIGIIAGGAFAGIALLILIISLVGGKKVVCKEEQELLGAKIKGNYTFKFNNDGELKGGKVVMEYDYSNYKEFKQEDFDKEYEEYKKKCEDEKNDCKVKKSGKKLTITGNMSEEDVKKYKENNKDFNYEGFKNGKVTGYGTCKAK